MHSEERLTKAARRILESYKETGFNPYESQDHAVIMAVDHFARLEAKKSFPCIVCLCGSTRFYEAFQKANYDLTMAGKIVLSVGFYPHSSEAAHGQTLGCDDEQKKKLDELHLRKIELADEVLILNVGGYIGESTRREVEYAKKLGKPLCWLESGPDPMHEEPLHELVAASM